MSVQELITEHYRDRYLRNTEARLKINVALPVALTAGQPAFVLYIELYFYRPAHARCWDVCNNT